MQRALALDTLGSFSMTGLEAGLSAAGMVSTAVAVYVGLKFDPLKERLEQDRRSAEKATRDLKDSLESRLAGIHDDAKDSREKLENRLQNIEKTYIDRAELSRAIEAFGERSDKNTARIEAVVIALGAKVDHLAERVAKTEAS